MSEADTASEQENCALSVYFLVMDRDGTAVCAEQGLMSVLMGG
ncbi:hypothetical protein [Thiohalophilus sp.]|nr:hypothetical protein [Thiohalophilus sp.]MDZ7803842.1 hypothetical protein [Thiohalophilus sp.]